jgi:hypothetical protein
VIYRTNLFQWSFDIFTKTNIKKKRVGFYPIHSSFLISIVCPLGYPARSALTALCGALLFLFVLAILALKWSGWFWWNGFLELWFTSYTGCFDLYQSTEIEVPGPYRVSIRIGFRWLLLCWLMRCVESTSTLGLAKPRCVRASYVPNTICRVQEIPMMMPESYGTVYASLKEGWQCRYAADSPALGSWPMVSDRNNLMLRRDGGG